MPRRPIGNIARNENSTPASSLRRCASSATSSGITILRKPTIDKIRPTPIDKFHFLGVWDTVDAYGGPIEEITRAIDYYYWPLSMPDQFMNQKITRACHALALEDERDAFKPVLWDDRYVRGDGKASSESTRTGNRRRPIRTSRLAPIDKERISQVWFVGVHSDIGGGYPQDGLSYVSLQWMMAARACVWPEYQHEADRLAAAARQSLRQAQRLATWLCRLLSVQAAQSSRSLPAAALQALFRTRPPACPAHAGEQGGSGRGGAERSLGTGACCASRTENPPSRP